LYREMKRQLTQRRLLSHGSHGSVLEAHFRGLEKLIMLYFS
jgi:hypothetical protein